jgi:2-oxoglutarate ferredoxin oxidoreductase subunit delta
MEKKKPVVVVNERYCKGCHICAEFCPTSVFEMRGFTAVVKNPDDCIGCMQCELRCPDFAVTVTQ